MRPITKKIQTFNMNVLVTGASGFIGSNIISVLRESDFAVLGLARSKPEINVDADFLEIDITDTIQTQNINVSKKFDAVIHCAGLAHQFGDIKKENFDRVNVTGTKNIVELAVRLQVKQFILISSTAVYGLNTREVDETFECHPETFYAQSKLKAESVCREICEQNEVALTIFRLTSVLGEKGIGNIPRLINAVYNRRFVWIGNGKNKKSLIYVNDVALACLKIIEAKKNSTETFNLASEPIEMRKLVEIIADEMDRKIPKINIPVNVLRKILGVNRKILKLDSIEKLSVTLEKWISDDIYISDKFINEYNFDFGTTIEEAVRKQCRWFLSKNIKP